MIKLKNYLLFSLAAIMAVRGLHAADIGQVEQVVSDRACKFSERIRDRSWDDTIMASTKLLEAIVILIGDYVSDKITYKQTQKIKISDDYAKPDLWIYKIYCLYALTDNRVAFSREVCPVEQRYSASFCKIIVFDNDGNDVETLSGCSHLKSFRRRPQAGASCNDRGVVRRDKNEISIELRNNESIPPFTIALPPIGSLLVKLVSQQCGSVNRGNLRKLPVQDIFVTPKNNPTVKIVLPDCEQPIRYVSCVAKDESTFTMLIRDKHDDLYVVTYSKCFGIDYPTKSQKSEKTYIQHLLTRAPYLPRVLAATSFGLGCLSAYRWYRNVSSPRELCATVGGALASGFAAFKLYRNQYLGRSW